MNHLLSRTLPLLLGITSTYAMAQVDIYQSDAYSVEEMCAREAEQHTTSDYDNAYDDCLNKNRDEPMYQSNAESSPKESEPTPDSTAHKQGYKDPEANPSRNR